MLTLKNLNESLNKLYESNELTEAWNESFPKWLSSRLSTLAKAHGTGYSGSGNSVGQMWSVPYSERPGYAKPRGQHISDVGDLSLFRKLLKNTDPQNLEVIEGDIPTSRKDPRLSGQNIPIWGFPNGQVYIPGFNDHEIAKGTTHARNGSMQFQHVPFKNLISDANHFAYIDGSKLPPSVFNDLREKRKQSASELRNMNYGRKGKDPDSFVQRNWLGDHDKSGYMVDPSKYKDKLARMQADNYSDALEKIHDMLAEYRDDISAAMTYYDPFDNPDEYSQISDLMNLLNRSISRYNSTARDIERYADNYEQDKDDYWKQCISQSIKQLKEYRDIKSIERIGSDVFLGSADWLE